MKLYDALKLAPVNPELVVSCINSNGNVDTICSGKSEELYSPSRASLVRKPSNIYNRITILFFFAKELQNYSMLNTHIRMVIN